MIKKLARTIDEFANKNGYHDRYELLMDYNFIPTVLTPNHHKIEILGLFFNRKRRRRK